MVNLSKLLFRRKIIYHIVCMYFCNTSLFTIKNISLRIAFLQSATILKRMFLVQLERQHLHTEHEKRPYIDAKPELIY